MRVQILYFAWLREAIGSAEETLELAAGGMTAGGLADLIASRGGAAAAAFANRRQVRIAVNQVFAPPETVLADGDEVAFFPPVTGG